jgi:hypothetical protein
MEEDYDNESNVNDNFEFNVKDLFNFKDNDNAVITIIDKGIDEDIGYDSDYNIKERDAIITDDVNDYFTAQVNKLREPPRQACDAVKPSEFKEAVWKYKALYYEDIYF